MKEMYERILAAEDDWSSSTDTLSFSCQELNLVLNRDEVWEGAFTVTGEPGRMIEGHVSCMEERMECLTPFFSGTSEEILCRFDARGMKEGETREGKLLIVSSQGEYELPFRAVVSRRPMLCSEGEMTSLFQFTGLARSHWEEAVGLFYSPDFMKLLHGPDRKLRNLYRGLSAVKGREENLEEFLVSAQKKQPVEYLLPVKELAVTAAGERQEEGQICETLRILRNGWGYTRLQAETEGDFLSLEKTVLREEDFLGNQCTLPVYISPHRLHDGRNYGRILLSHRGGQTAVNVTVVKEREHRSMRGSRRQEMKRLMVELVELYQEYKMKKCTASDWHARTAQVVERMRRMDEKALEARLYQAHLLITEERYEEAGRMLELMRVTPMEDSPELYSYYLYLSSLYRREDGFTSQALLEIEEMYRAGRGSWRIAWLLLFLSPTLRRSGSRKWIFLEEQFRKNGTSPVLYLEALHLLNRNPALLMKLGSYELQLLHFGARKGLLSEDLAGQTVYLAEKEKYYSQPLFRILKACYEKKQSVPLLQAICSLLIKGNKFGPEYYEWYRQGVEHELRVTRLYEYYMMSLDLETETEIPKMVLMYFAYQSNLEQEQCACLYAYVHKHREELPELYLAYRGQIDRFILQQLYKGRVSTHLAYLYQSVMEQRMLTKDNCAALAPILFLQQLDCGEKDIVKAVVIHSGLSLEEEYPVEEGRAFVRIYDRDYEILLEDGRQNRYSVSRPFTLTRLMEPSAYVKTLQPYVKGDLGFDLYVCGGRKGGKEEKGHRGRILVNQGNVERFHALASCGVLLPSYAGRIRMALLRFYEGKEEFGQLDLMLEGLERPDVAEADRYEAVQILVRRSFYEKAYAWMEGLLPEKMDEKILLRLCSRLLEAGRHTGEARMMCMAASAFFRGKYDTYLLQYLAEYYEGSCTQLLQIRQAAEDFAVDTYSLTERILVQLLYTESNVMDKAGLLRSYLIEGGKGELEAAFLHRCAGLYLMEGEAMDPGVLSGIERAVGKGEGLSDLCALAFLEYYSRQRGERSEQTDAVIRTLGEGLLRRGVQLPLFQEYGELLEGASRLADRTIVVYRGRKAVPVTIHYRVVRAGEREDAGFEGIKSLFRKGEAEEEKGLEAEEYFRRMALRSMDMKHVYAGIYTAGFVLFAGEILQYVITDSQSGQICDRGELKTEDRGGGTGGGRYGKLNGIVSAWLLQERGGAQDRLEQYLMEEWMTDGLFKSME